MVPLKESHVTRKSLQAYLQDKIHISDKWDITPSIRYAKYSSFETTNDNGTSQGKGDTHLITPVINTNICLMIPAVCILVGLKYSVR